MENVEKLVKTTLEEIEKLLNTKTVVGDAVKVDGATIIPLVAVGFGFGAGGGSGETKGADKGSGFGGGTAGGGGIKPIAMIVIDKGGVRVEPIMGGLATAVEKMGEVIPNAVEKMGETIPKLVTKLLEKKGKKEE